MMTFSQAKITIGITQPKSFISVPYLMIKDWRGQYYFKRGGHYKPLSPPPRLHCYFLHHVLGLCYIQCPDKILVQLTVSSRLSDVSQIIPAVSRDVTARAGREVPGGRLQGGRVEHGRGHVRADCCCGADVDQKSYCEEGQCEKKIDINY